MRGESMMYVLVRTWWIIGTVYLSFDVESWEAKPLEKFGLDNISMSTERPEDNLQLFQRRFNVWELEKDGPVGDLLIVEHEAGTPYYGREADILGAGQVVQDDLRLAFVGHDGMKELVLRHPGKESVHPTHRITRMTHCSLCIMTQPFINMNIITAGALQLRDDGLIMISSNCEYCLHTRHALG